MSDRPESTAPAPPDSERTYRSPYSDRYPTVDEGEHPLRETYLAFVHPDHRATLAAPLALLHYVVLEASVPSYGGVPTLGEQVRAVARDLRWTVDYIRGGLAGPAFGSEIEPEEHDLCRFAIDFAVKLDDLTGGLEAFVEAWHGPERRP